MHSTRAEREHERVGAIMRVAFGGIGKLRQV